MNKYIRELVKKIRDERKPLKLEKEKARVSTCKRIVLVS